MSPLVKRMEALESRLTSGIALSQPSEPSQVTPAPSPVALPEVRAPTVATALGFRWPDGKRRQLPHTFEFPSSTLYEGWCLWLEGERALFTGDVLQVVRGRLTYASSIFSHDYPAARLSVSRLAELDPSLIAMAHYRPWTLDCRARLQDLALGAGAHP